MSKTREWVEKIGRNIFNALAENGGGDVYLRLGRAALNSMRDPSQGMMGAAEPYVFGYEDMRSFYMAWREAIDHAIEEST